MYISNLDRCFSVAIKYLLKYMTLCQILWYAKRATYMRQNSILIFSINAFQRKKELDSNPEPVCVLFTFFDSSSSKPETPLMDFRHRSRFGMQVIGRCATYAVNRAGTVQTDCGTKITTFDRARTANCTIVIACRPSRYGCRLVRSTATFACKPYVLFVVLHVVRTEWAQNSLLAIFEQQHVKMTCAANEDSDQPGHPPSLIRVFAVRMKKSWVLSYPFSEQRRLRSDWADAQTDLSLRWTHMSFYWFCYAAAHL